MAAKLKFLLKTIAKPCNKNDFIEKKQTRFNFYLTLERIMQSLTLYIKSISAYLFI